MNERLPALVDGEDVLSEGARVLAFVDTMEEQGMLWKLMKVQDGRYLAATMYPGTMFIFEGFGNTPGAAVKALSDTLVAKGLESAGRA